jgi:hypothetical protein
MLLVISIGAPTLIYPFGRDQGNLAYSGSLILKGQIPHRDSWDQKPPGVAYLYALAFLLFGKSVEAVRSLDLIYHLLAAFFLFKLVETLYKGFTAFLAGLFYSLSYFIQSNYFSLAHVDGFLNLPFIAAAYTCYRGQQRGSNVLLFLTGFLCSLAFIIKYPSLLVLIGFSVYLLSGTSSGSMNGHPPRIQRYTGIGSIWSGFILGLLLMALFLFWNDSLSSLIETQLVFNAGYTRLAFQEGFISFLSTALVQLIRYLYYKSFFSVLALTGLVYCFKHRTSENRLILAWFFANLFIVIIQAKFYFYHWMSLVAPFSILSAMGFSRLFQDFRFNRSYFKNENIIFAAVALFLLILPILNSYSRISQTFISVLTGTLSLQGYYTQLDSLQGDFTFATTQAVVDYIQQHTTPQDTIYIWGSEPLIYFLADRSSPTRYTFNVPLLASWGKPSWREELVHDLVRSRPRYFIVVERDEMPWTTGRTEDSKTLLEEFPALKTFLVQNYKEEKRFNQFILYKLNSPS